MTTSTLNIPSMRDRVSPDEWATRVDLAAWLHGIVHILEGDLDNAKGWYGRSERAYPGPAAMKDELAAARRAVDAA